MFWLAPPVSPRWTQTPSMRTLTPRQYLTSRLNARLLMNIARGYSRTAVEVYVIYNLNCPIYNP